MLDTQIKRNQKGFTLVEVSIVLVSIGLLLGGVMKGQELITNAKINSMVKDLKNIGVAHYAYRDRVGIVAGDGNNDHLIDDDSDFWNALYTEGFMSGVATPPPPPPPFDPFAFSIPRIPDSPLNGVKHALNGLFYVGGDTGIFEGKNFACAVNVRASYAQGIDIKQDDGNPLTGFIRTRVDVEPPERESEIDPIPNPTTLYEGNGDKASHLCMVM